jgi:hypothetical protein
MNCQKPFENVTEFKYLNTTVTTDRAIYDQT